MFQWDKSCAYDEQQKQRFHATARSRLKKLAAELGLPPGGFEIRSSKGGVAVSGEVTLHHTGAYIQVGQFGLSSGHGILIRTCRGRGDYSGGPNHSSHSSCSMTFRRLPQPFAPSPVSGMNVPAHRNSAPPDGRSPIPAQRRFRQSFQFANCRATAPCRAVAGSAHLETSHVRSSTIPKSLRRRRHPRTDVSTV